MRPQGSLAVFTNAEMPKIKELFGKPSSSPPAWEDHDALLPVLANHAQLVLPLALNLPQQLKCHV